ncbi:MAG: helix-turn-helix domain-containing protein [Desulfobacteraceae bacterium]|nr:helix-turn-helix domain-containing protein [Desulfobacteraceae bacterium]
MDGSGDREFVNSLAKGLNLLMCFTKDRPVWSLTEMARANGMNLPTARRYLYTFTKLGFMVKDETSRTFQLTSKVMQLGGWVFESMGLRDRLMPFMKSIKNEMDVTTHCAVLEGIQIVAVERILSSDVVNIDLSAGSRLPIHATSLGKAIVAFMDHKEQKKIAALLEFKQLTPHTITDVKSFLKDLKTTRSRGYAVADQELNIGLKTLAIPIFNKKGLVEASFGVSFPLSRSQEPGFEDLLTERLFEVKNKV